MQHTRIKLLQNYTRQLQRNPGVYRGNNIKMANKQKGCETIRRLWQDFVYTIMKFRQYKGCALLDQLAISLLTRSFASTVHEFVIQLLLIVHIPINLEVINPLSPHTRILQDSTQDKTICNNAQARYLYIGLHVCVGLHANSCEPNCHFSGR